ncbi:MAG: hypothetical protein WA364_17595, partial [Candidatus Nitrosopolaris sp.]
SRSPHRFRRKYLPHDLVRLQRHAVQRRATSSSSSSAPTREMLLTCKPDLLLRNASSRHDSTVAALTAVTFLSESFVVAQGLGNDPISGCFKAIGKTEVETGGIQNWTESIQNFVSYRSHTKINK